MSKSKKILIILAVVLTLTLIGLAVYYFFSKKSPVVVPPTDQISSLTDELAPSTRERLIPITEETVLAASLVKSGQDNATGTEKIIYAAWDGSINQINYNGQNKNKIGLVAVERIGEVKISPNGGLLAFRYALSTGLNRYLIYNTASRSLKTLPQNTAGVSFGGDNEVMILLNESGATKIVQSSADLAKTKDVTTSKIPDLVLDWLSDNSSAALKTKPSGLAQGILYLLDLKTKKTKRVMGGVYGLTSNFSPSGEKVLASQTDAEGFNLQLLAVNLEKNTKRNLNLFTLPEKCAWSQDERVVFCSAIKSNSEDYVMPDDYYKRRVRSGGEEMVRINLETGQVQKIIGNVFDATNLFLSPDENYLFFINKIDGRLYRLTL